MPLLRRPPPDLLTANAKSRSEDELKSLLAKFPPNEPKDDRGSLIDKVFQAFDVDGDGYLNQQDWD